MTVTETPVDTTAAAWQFADPACRQNMLRTIESEAAGLRRQITDSTTWQAPTAAGHWQVRDIAAHVTDALEDTIARFASPEPLSQPLGLAAMAAEEDRVALSYRGADQDEIVARFDQAVDGVLSLLEDCSDEEWAGGFVSHKFMGPLPKGFYSLFALVDLAIHSWDISEGSGRPHVLDEDAADLLVPMGFMLWQYTADTSDVSEPFDVGLRVTGRNGGDTVATVSPEGIQFVPGDLANCPAVLEYDAASFVLTAEGRTNSGTLIGDRSRAEEFLDLFFRI